MSTLRGRFGAPAVGELVRYASSIGVDLRMAVEDVAGSKAHARMLGEVGVLRAGLSKGL